MTNDTDVDSAGNGETKAVNGVAAGAVGAAAGNVGVAVTGSYGSVSIASDGSYTYTIDNTNATVQALRTSGQTITDLFTYRIVDAGGLTSLATLTVTIQGANDNPIGVNDTATATEAGGVANGTAGSDGSGNVLTNDTDVDSSGNGETKAVNGVAAGLSVLRQVMLVWQLPVHTGRYRSRLTGVIRTRSTIRMLTVQALRTSVQTITDLFTYEVVDAGGLTSLATLTVTIQGANDNPLV